MEKHGAKIKKFLLGFILVILLMPLIQQHIKFYDSAPLKGALVPAPKVFFNLGDWWSGVYQEGYETWYNENFGFRQDLVRVHNQIGYSFFGRAYANGVVIGRDNYLYEERYIEAYTGKDYLGKPQINDMTGKIKLLQDSLEKKGITLLVCLAPGKASFYPEFIPTRYGSASDSTNYKMFAQLLEQKQINHIDYNKWFMSMKGKTEFPLYPKTGIHWSRYGSMLAIDSLISYVEKKRNVDMPNVIWERTILSDSLQSPDQDIGLAMNLVWPIKPYFMGYPVYHFEDTTGKAHVKLMTISDSFFWNMFDIGLAPSTFSDIKFYYYNNEVYHSDGSPMTIADIESEMFDAEQSDVIVLMATESNLFGLGWGFIDDGFNQFVAHKMVQSQDRLVKQYQAMIRKDEKWMADIRVKAQQNGITLDSMIYLDAKYMADEAWKNMNK